MATAVSAISISTGREKIIAFCVCLFFFLIQCRNLPRAPLHTFPSQLIGQNCHLSISQLLTAKENGVIIMGTTKHWTVRRRILLTKRRGGMTDEQLGNQQGLLQPFLVGLSFCCCCLFFENDRSPSLHIWVKFHVPGLLGFLGAQDKPVPPSS